MLYRLDPRILAYGVEEEWDRLYKDIKKLHNMLKLMKIELKD